MINLIDEKDVSAATLSLELEKATIQYNTHQDNSLYVVEDGWFPFWISVLPKSGLVVLSTHVELRESASELERLLLANAMNRSAYGITAYVSGDQLMIEHILNFRDGLLRETFIRVSRNFSKVIEKVMKEHDADFQILIPLYEKPVRNTDEGQVA